MAAAFKPGTTKKGIHPREGGAGLRLDIEPVPGGARSADTKCHEIGFATGLNVVRGGTGDVVSGAAAFVDSRATERAGPFERALRHAP